MGADGIFTSTENERNLIRAVACPRCGVQRGRWCRRLTLRTEPARELHLARIKAYQEAGQ